MVILVVFACILYTCVVAVNKVVYYTLSSLTKLIQFGLVIVSKEILKCFKSLHYEKFTKRFVKP